MIIILTEKDFDGGTPVLGELYTNADVVIKRYDDGRCLILKDRYHSHGSRFTMTLDEDCNVTIFDQ